MNKKFDIFISFKATDNGAVTEDAHVASELYHELTERGFQVFFSAETLNNGRSSDFSKEIDAALDEAQLLIVVSSSVSYVNSRWVEYEWKNFNNDILSNVKKDAQIITYTNGIDSRELPRVLRYVQNYAYDNRAGLLSFVCGFFGQEERHVSAPTQSVKSKKKGVKKDSDCDHTLYNSAGSGEFEILRIRERRSYSLDMKAIASVKSRLTRQKYNVLVLGCAYGFIAETRFGLDDDVENVICIDKNAEVIDKARELYCGYPHMKFYQLDLQSADYVPYVQNVMRELGIDGIDIAFSSDLFRYLNNPALTMRNTRKLLRRDGMLIIRDCDDSNKMAYPDRDGILNEIVDISEKLTGMPNFYIGRELPLLIRNGGFDITDVRLDIESTINMTFEEKEDFFRSTFASRKNIANQIRESGSEQTDLIDRMSRSIDRFENIFFDMNFWYSESNMIFIGKKS